MGTSVLFSELQIAVHLFSKMKAFVAALSSLVAAASGEPQILANFGYAGYGGYAGLTYAGAPALTSGLTYATAPAVTTVAAAAPAIAAPALAAAPAFAPVAYGAINPYDYAGQIYPVAEPYIHQEIPAEEYVHTEIAAEPYIHTEVPAEPYIHAEVIAEPYIHQEPIAIAPVAIAAPAQLTYAAAPAQLTYAAAPSAAVQYGAVSPAAYGYGPASYNYAPSLAYNNYGAYPYGILPTAAALQ